MNIEQIAEQYTREEFLGMLVHNGINGKFNLKIDALNYFYCPNELILKAGVPECKKT